MNVLLCARTIYVYIRRKMGWFFQDKFQITVIPDLEPFFTFSTDGNSTRGLHTDNMCRRAWDAPKDYVPVRWSTHINHCKKSVPPSHLLPISTQETPNPACLKASQVWNTSQPVSHTYRHVFAQVISPLRDGLASCIPAARREIYLYRYVRRSVSYWCAGRGYAVVQYPV